MNPDLHRFTDFRWIRRLFNVTVRQINFMASTRQFENRKKDHITQALRPTHQAHGLSGLERIHLFHDALPEISPQDLDLTTPCLGQTLPTPFFVAGITAGHAQGDALNLRLAEACAAQGWALGVGSQRRELLHRGDKKSIQVWKRVRQTYPNLFLIANVGLSQLIETPLEQITELCTNLGANALAIHANALQEMLQPEGTPSFRGGIAALKKLIQVAQVPVLLKETGCGFSSSTLEKIAGIGLGAVDVSGLGGTHWGRIEGARARNNKNTQSLATASETFANWGESTVASVLAAKKTLPAATAIWGSGGVRTGLDAARLVALGAHRVGYAQPALAAALKGKQTLRNWMKQQELEFRIALLCTGCKTPAELRSKETAWTQNHL